MATTATDLVKQGIISVGPSTRCVPHFSGEGAIYSPEYLARKEGNAKGTEPERWYFNVRG
ncbi:hypothetical protein [Streptomyces sp. NPDC010273]|uniref:hypothetical protein n=1 Tax=Streptomyces sp. NPDC010273 TaxID=3364829 RepID=UPI0036E64843